MKSAVGFTLPEWAKCGCGADAKLIHETPTRGFYRCCRDEKHEFTVPAQRGEA